MNLAAYNAYCATLPGTTSVVQWGGSHVWKVGGKVFAIGAIDGRRLYVTFKCTPMSYELLKDGEGCRPAPYLASRGMIWIQRTGPGILDADGLRIYLRESHRLVALGLPKRMRASLNLRD